MKQMYAITLSTGSYDDYNREIVFVTDDFEKGTSYVNEKNTIFETLEKKLSEFYKQDMVQWNHNNPRPERGGFNLHPIPKWKGNEVITQQMRDERESLVQQNNLITQKANEPLEKWSQDHMAFVKDWLKTNLNKEETEMNEHNNENRWDIEPVKWL
jgi:hypothetical protein